VDHIAGFDHNNSLGGTTRYDAYRIPDDTTPEQELWMLYEALSALGGCCAYRGADCCNEDVAVVVIGPMRLRYALYRSAGTQNAIAGLLCREHAMDIEDDDGGDLGLNVYSTTDEAVLKHNATEYARYVGMVLAAGHKFDIPTALNRAQEVHTCPVERFLARYQPKTEAGS
jgi:hypothetical protein